MLQFATVGDELSDDSRRPAPATPLMRTSGIEVRRQRTTRRREIGMESGGNRIGANSHVPAKNVTKLDKAEVQGGIQSLKTSVIAATKQIIFEDKREDVPRTSLGDAANPDSIITEEKHEDADPKSSLMDSTNSDKIIAEEKIEGRDSSALKVNVDTVVIEIDDEGEANGKGPDDVHIIDLDVASENAVVENAGSLEKIWNYLDPSGNVQGPFSIRTLEYWMEEGFFDEDFRIWKHSQSQENAIPLGVALALLQ
ncbi:hypothetical protein KFK09_021623 [Dendrobium nobile]|uniref:GYF domain-containing protein n=1 Tax=Dendrobium nobile TaxID=94219 RepID=A0A8T3ARP0_DENNO|nr:hypothetical protein KFK09_021623 [Dendrobium nobile]